MKRTTVLQDVRLMRFNEVYGSYQQGRLNCEEAALVLGISTRTFLRYRDRYEEEGEKGLSDRRIGRASGRQIPADEAMKITELYTSRYFDFNVKHFHEKLVSEHKIMRGYTWTKSVLQKAGLVGKAKCRGKHRRRRPRKPLPGMMLHQDGSRHAWVAGLEVMWDLIVTMDDATSETFSMFFVDEEGTMSTFQGLMETIEQCGLFCSFYTDRGSHYWHTESAGGKVDKVNLTQVGRAMKQLGIEMIAAYSPEARGRSERMFETLQGRLPQELRLAGVTTMEEANRYLQETYLPDHNVRFRVKAEEAGSAFTKYQGPHLNDILCIEEERTVGNDNTVRYQKKVLQLPSDCQRHHYAKVKVRVHEHIDGQLSVFYGPRCLARYLADGTLIQAKLTLVA